MTTASRPVITTATAARIDLARTRRMIEDTAIAAVPGAVVEHLAADAGSDHLWTARVRSADGGRRTLRLDRLLQTVEVAADPALARAA